MFYSGSLQEGIAAAVAESKAVVCFVRGSFIYGHWKWRDAGARRYSAVLTQLLR